MHLDKEETSRIAWNRWHSANFLSVWFKDSFGRKEGLHVVYVCGLQGTNQNKNQEKVSSSPNLCYFGSDKEFNLLH